jgi:hypothetical protein
MHQISFQNLEPHDRLAATATSSTPPTTHQLHLYRLHNPSHNPRPCSVPCKPPRRTEISSKRIPSRVFFLCSSATTSLDWTTKFSVCNLQQALDQLCLHTCLQASPLLPQVKARVAILEMGGATGEEAGTGMLPLDSSTVRHILDLCSICT